MSLDGTYDDANVFAKILRGELPCAKVYEDDVVLAFLDLFPQSKGHTLVIPKAKARNAFDIAEKDFLAFMSRVRKVADGVRDAMQPDGLVLTQYNGGPAGQTVFHLHFHIIPRYDGVSLGRHGAAMADKDVLAEQAKLIAAALA